MTPTKQTFIDLAKQCQNAEEFVRGVRKIKDVPENLSLWFINTYGESGKISIYEAVDRFMGEHG